MMKPRYMVVDCETEGLRWYADSIHGFAVCYDDDAEPIYYPAVAVPAMVREQIADPTIPLVGHRLRFDWKFLAQSGFSPGGDFICTKVLAHVIDETQANGLKDLAVKYLGPGALSDKREMDQLCLDIVGDVFKKDGTPREKVPAHIGELCEADLMLPDRPFTPIIARYCIEDARNTRAILRIMGKELRELDVKVKQLFGASKGPFDYYFEESMPAEQALAKMELGGIAVDRAKVEAYRNELSSEIERVLGELNAVAAPWTAPVEATLLEKHLKALITEKARERRRQNPPRFNWASPQQIGALLYDHMKLPPIKRTATGGRATDEGTLLLLKDRSAEPQVITKLLELRALEKMRGTYADGILERLWNGRIYAEYPPFTDTGRLSSVNPNMQNIPRSCPVKRAFIPDRSDQCFLYFDYSQVELRIAASESRDPVMVDWFDLGIDPHRQAASKTFGIAEENVQDWQRQAAKSMNFLTIFDGKAGRLEETLKDAKVLNVDGRHFTKDECGDFLGAWWVDHKPYRAYLDGVLAKAIRFGAVLASNGRLRRLPDIKYGQWIDQRSRRFIGPREELVRIEREIAEGRAGDIVYAAPKSQQVFVYCAMRFSHAKKQAYNHGIQSVGASITKSAIVAFTKLGCTVRTTVHDMILVQVPRASALPAVEILKKTAEEAYKLSVPLKCDSKILNSLSEKDKFEASTVSISTVAQLSSQRVESMQVMEKSATGAAC